MIEFNLKKIKIWIYMLCKHPVIFFKKTITTNLLIKSRSNINNIDKIKEGNNVVLGYDTRINFFGDSRLYIGSGTYCCNRNSFLVGADIKIGENVLLASDICITSENHGINPESKKFYMNQDLVFSPVEIGDGCWIGEKAIILPGVKIGKKSIIGAGSIVTTSIPDYSIAVGNPAKVIKKYNVKEKQWEYVK
ncbi:acyltransferase [Streptococcus sp. S784/96/1]|nr:DapH/DapD/GlmU-related protein [Streptococcus sp. S784/96/1]